MSDAQPAVSSRHAFLALLHEQIPDEALETFPADPDLKNAPEGISETGSASLFAVPETSYTCVTQRTQSSLTGAIILGMAESIPRWKKGQVVQYAALKTGYPSPAHATFATYKLAQAVAEWNSHDLGVTFKWVDKVDDAAFVLEYGGNKGGVLAEAFFPNNEPLNQLFVYKGAFSRDSLPIQKNIFLHELGHVLGLRHEFALEKEKFLPAVRFGSENPHSVMSYEFPPTIQPSDIEDAKAFYNYADESFGGLKIVDWEADN